MFTGLDASGYRQSVRHYEDENDALLGAQEDDEERFKDADRFKFICPNGACKRENIVDSVFTGTVIIAISHYLSVYKNLWVLSQIVKLFHKVKYAAYFIQLDNM